MMRVRSVHGSTHRPETRNAGTAAVVKLRPEYQRPASLKAIALRRLGVRLLEGLRYGAGMGASFTERRGNQTRQAPERRGAR